jgi:hypothetical protein
VKLKLDMLQVREKKKGDGYKGKGKVNGTRGHYLLWIEEGYIASTRT